MFKDLIVHLDGTEEDENRLVHADVIASRFDARLTGLYTNPLPEYAYVLAIQSGMAPMGPVVELEDQVRRQGDRVIAGLRERWARLGVANQIRRIDAGLSELPRRAALQARWADLFVGTAPYRSGDPSSWDSLVEAVLFESGRGVYLVRPQSKAKPALGRVLVAWDDTREAARAIAEALPLLRAAESTSIMTIESPHQRETRINTSDIASHLERHGARTCVLSVEAGGNSIAKILLNQARGMDADLVVMGAYGHSRLREWILGGTTREMIEHSEVPLLLAH